MQKPASPKKHSALLAEMADANLPKPSHAENSRGNWTKKPTKNYGEQEANRRKDKHLVNHFPSSTQLANHFCRGMEKERHCSVLTTFFLLPAAV
jgi:hypothetical protein